MKDFLYPVPKNPVLIINLNLHHSSLGDSLFFLPIFHSFPRYKGKTAVSMIKSLGDLQDFRKFMLNWEVRYQVGLR